MDVNGYSIAADADLTGADLRRADLTGADLRGADLTDANLSQSQGLTDAADYIAAHFERDSDGRGIIAYKVFGAYNPPPASWQIAPGAVLREVVNPDRCTDCGSGVNVATRAWLARYCPCKCPIWRVLIRWEWLPSVILPFGTDGKIRAGRVELLEVVET